MLFLKFFLTNLNRYVIMGAAWRKIKTQYRYCTRRQRATNTQDITQILHSARPRRNKIAQILHSGAGAERQMRMILIYIWVSQMRMRIILIQKSKKMVADSQPNFYKKNWLLWTVVFLSKKSHPCFHEWRYFQENREFHFPASTV